MQGSLSSDSIMQGSCGHAYALENVLNLQHLYLDMVIHANLFGDTV